MNFSDYEKKARSTAIYPDIGHNFVYPTLGLVEEAGEVAEKIKKVLRDTEGVVSFKAKEAILDELGDVLWYLTNVGAELGLTLEAIAERNIDKLQSRQKRNQLRGSGDNR